MANEKNMKQRVLRIDQEVDIKSRSQGVKIHTIAKKIKIAGFPIKTLCGTLTSDSNFQVRKQFSLPKDNVFSMLEFLEQPIEENDKIEDWLVSNTHLKIINSGVYEYPNGVKVFRIIVDCSHIKD